MPSEEGSDSDSFSDSDQNGPTSGALKLPDSPIKPSLPPPTSSSQSTNPKQELVGYVLMFSSAMCFSVHSLCIRLSETWYEVPFVANILFRGFVHSGLCMLYFCFSAKRTTGIFPSSRNSSSQMSRKTFWLLLLRGFIGALSLFLLYYAVNFIEVGMAVSIFFVTSVLTIVLSRTLLQEPVTNADITAVVLCLVGVYLITTSTYESSLTASLSDSEKLYGKFLIAMGSLLASGTFTIIRYIGMDVSFMTSVFSFASFCLLGALVSNGPTQLATYVASLATKSTQFSLGACASVVAASFASFAAQCGLNAGLQKCRAGAGVLITNVEVPFTFSLAFLFLNETPGVLTIAGSSLILLGAVIVGVTQLLEQRRKLSSLE